MAQTIYFNCDAQSPAASLVDGVGNIVPDGIAFVNGDTRPLRFYARSGGAASTDYTPTLHDIDVTIGMPGSSTSAITYVTGSASTGSGDYWDVSLVMSDTDLSTLVSDGIPHEVTMEVKLTARTGGAEFTPVLKKIQVYPGMP